MPANPPIFSPPEGMSGASTPYWMRNGWWRMEYRCSHRNLLKCPAFLVIKMKEGCETDFNWRKNHQHDPDGEKLLEMKRKAYEICSQDLTPNQRRRKAQEAGLSLSSKQLSLKAYAIRTENGPVRDKSSWQSVKMGRKPTLTSPLKKIVLFGDSLTQQCFNPGGWGCTLADHFVRRCDIVNRGFGGYDSNEFQTIFPSLLKQFKPYEIACITLLIRENDPGASMKNPSQHIGLADYSKNLKNLVQAALDHGLRKKQIILISPPLPPPQVDSELEESCTETLCRDCHRLNYVCETYVSAMKQVSSDSEITFVPLFDIMSSKPNVDDLLNDDGSLLSQAGSALLTDALIPVLESRVDREIIDNVGPQSTSSTEETSSNLF